ncbi:MAG: hypothetical protein AAB426_12235 [Myxococcota bacterium]
MKDKKKQDVRRRRYEPPKVLEEQVFERQALQACAKIADEVVPGGQCFPGPASS